MVVKKLEKVKKKYLVLIDDKEYTFLEDVILKYKILENHIIDEGKLEEAISLNNTLEFYDKAVTYQLKYNKGEAEVKRYLYNKGLKSNDIYKILTLMKEKKILNDDNVLASLVSSLVRKQNGKALIREKLYQKGFTKEQIESHLENIDMDMYYEYLEKLYLKIKHRYDKLEKYARTNRIKAYLFSRGYSISEISILDLN